MTTGWLKTGAPTIFFIVSINVYAKFDAYTYVNGMEIILNVEILYSLATVASVAPGEPL